MTYSLLHVVFHSVYKSVYGAAHYKQAISCTVENKSLLSLGFIQSDELADRLITTVIRPAGKTELNCVCAQRTMIKNKGPKTFLFRRFAETCSNSP